jgi:hypothetical protein
MPTRFAGLLTERPISPPWVALFIRQCYMVGGERGGFELNNAACPADA